MSELSQVLERMQISLIAKEQSENLLNSQKHGSISGAGSLTTQYQKTQETNLPNLNHGQTQGSSLPQNTPPKPNLRSKQQLAVLLSQVCALQKSYGKSQDEIETLVEGFSWALDGFDISEIMAAMRKYILTKSDIPAPADILAIIKENRFLESVKKPDYATLARYRKKGIRLTDLQNKQLDEYEASQCV